MRRVFPEEARALADLFRRGKLVHSINLTVGEIAIAAADIGGPTLDNGWRMDCRTIMASQQADAVLVNGRPGRLYLMVGQWSEQPDNEQIVLGSNRRELDPRFSQINLNVSLTDGRVVYLVKNLSGGRDGAMKRLDRGATGPEMAHERAMRRKLLAERQENGTIFFDGEEWLVVTVLPLSIPPRRADALFTEAMAQFLRYAAQVEHLRRGADPGEEDRQDGRGAGGIPHRLSAAERKLIELEAMAIVRSHLEAQGYRLKDVASRESYDFEARKGDELRYVEVKGTTSHPWSVEITAPEHRVATREGRRYDLYVVVFGDLKRLDRFELLPVGNPLFDDRYKVSPVRYRVQGR